MESENNSRFIITGAPGSGKTSLVNSFAKMGYKVFPENARLLIAEGFVAPIHNQRTEIKRGSFFREILRMRISQYKDAPENEPSFFDRGIPDSLAFSQFMGKPPDESLTEAVKKFRYNENVFILPPDIDIFHQDEIRKETYDDSLKLHELLILNYEKSGYKIIETPILPIPERANFIINYLIEAGLLSNKPVS